MTALAWLLAAGLAAAGWEPVEVVATAYCPCAYCCGHRAAGLTANGTDVHAEPYGIAADPARLPYGSVVYIPPGNGYLDRSRTNEAGRMFTVDDTGGIVRRRTRATGVLHLDLRFVHHGNAERFGVRRFTAYLWAE